LVVHFKVQARAKQALNNTSASMGAGTIPEIFEMAEVLSNRFVYVKLCHTSACAQ
jgi:hypothetical protein